METFLEFISNLSNIAVVGLIASMSASIITWFISQNIQKRRAKERDELITRALDLSILALQGEKRFNLRASVMLLDKNGKLRIIYRSANMTGAPDLVLVYDKWQGAAGKALGYQAPVIADLTFPDPQKGEMWGLTKEQLAITQEIKTILSFPIRDPNNMEKVVGILNIDSNESIADYLQTAEVKDIVSRVATQIALLLRGTGAI